MKLKVFGLDGGDFYTIERNLNRLKNWKRLVEKFPLSVLWANIRSRYSPCKFNSAMLWTSIFTGVRPEVHRIYGFKKRFDCEELTEPSDAKAKFVWETSKKKFVVWHVPAVLPPINFGCKSYPRVKTEKGRLFLTWMRGQKACTSYWTQLTLISS